MMKVYFILIVFNFFCFIANAADCNEIVKNEYFISVARLNSFELDPELRLIEANVTLGRTEKGCSCLAFTEYTYLPASSSVYIGDFIVEISSTCKEAADIILRSWTNSKYLKVYPAGKSEALN